MCKLVNIELAHRQYTLWQITKNTWHHVHTTDFNRAYALIRGDTRKNIARIAMFPISPEVKAEVKVEVKVEENY